MLSKGRLIYKISQTF